MGLLDLFRKKSSGDVAKDRLKLLLVSDRANCSPEMMEMIKRDIIEVFPNTWISMPTRLMSRSRRPNPMPTTAWYRHSLRISQSRIWSISRIKNRILDLWKGTRSAAEDWFLLGAQFFCLKLLFFKTILTFLSHGDMVITQVMNHITEEPEKERSHLCMNEILTQGKKYLPADRRIHRDWHPAAASS